MIPYTPPALGVETFNCPHCQAHAQQYWSNVGVSHQSIGSKHVDRLMYVECNRCHGFGLWLDEQMLFPDASGVPTPSPDLDDGIQADYIEAASIVNKSPRGAAALLRLCIQNVCVQLGEGGTSLDRAIGNLVRKGLPTTIQQALDIVRVVGNNAVHPGELDLRDDRDTALKLFGLVNLIAQIMITQPREIAALYDSLPEGARQAIERRDAGNSPAQQ